MTFGERLKELRRKHKLSQKEVGEFVSVSEHLVGKWEKNERDINTANLKKLSDLFDCSIDFLLCRTNIPLNEVEQRIYDLMDEELVLKWLKEKGVPVDDHSIKDLRDMLKMIQELKKMC